MKPRSRNLYIYIQYIHNYTLLHYQANTNMISNKSKNSDKKPKQRRRRVSKDQLIKILNNKIQTQPTSPRAPAWKKQLYALQNPKNNRRNNTRQPPAAMANKQRIVRRVKEHVESHALTQGFSEEQKTQFEVAMGETLGTIVNPQAGGYRLCDNVQTPTATFTVTTLYPIYANALQYDGRFTAMIQPRFGSTEADPSQWRVALWNPDSNNIDFSDAASFYNFIDGVDASIIPEGAKLLQGPNVQNTQTIQTIQSGSYTGGQLEFTSIGQSGTNNADFYWIAANTSHYGITPPHGSLLVSDGVCFHSLISTLSNNASSPVYYLTENNRRYTTGQNNNKNYIYRIQVYKCTKQQSTIIEDYRFFFNTQDGSTGTYNNTFTNNEFIRFFNGTISAPTGSGSSTNNLYSSTMNCKFYTVLPTLPNNGFYYISFWIEECGILDFRPEWITFEWNTTSTTLGSPVQSSQSDIQKVRTNALQVWFKPIVSSLNDGGYYTLAQLPADSQTQLFSSTGFSETSVQKITSYNLPKSRINKPIREGGAIAFYVGEQLIDYSLKTYTQDNEYEYPTIVLSGNYSPNTPTAVTQKIGELVVTQTIEFTTLAQRYRCKSQPGTDAYFQAVLGGLLQCPRVICNPSHKELIEKILKTAQSYIAGAVRVAPAASNLVTAIAQIVAMF